jgi:predicted ATPase/transcriptional regulator with XRE-family HTH domain
MLLRRFRLAAGLSQEALAERARMSANGIGALERGYRRSPQRETLALLAGALALDDTQREGFEAAAARAASPRRLGGSSVTVGPWADATISNLPLSLKSFVGREMELDEAGGLVREHRLVTIAGVGGLGKTETALQVGRAMSNGVNAAVCFVALAPLSDPSLVVTEIASTLGIQEVSNRPLLETLVAYLKNKTILLILDNCEHVISQAAEVAEAILTRCAHVRILATSRESLRAAGEHSCRLPSLSFPSPEASRQIRATDAAAYGAIVLFTDRARAADHRFALTDENAPTVVQLCRHLDGIPLAIELAAARVNQLSVKALANRLDDCFRILTGGERTALARQQTMRATIDWSYDLLSAPERRVFERLSVFAGGCTLDAATNVCAGHDVSADCMLDLLSSLVDKSLLATDLQASEPRYYLLESFRQYAFERLATRREEQIVARRHAHAFLEQAQRLDRAHFYEPDEIVCAHADRELANWRAALQWTLSDRGDVLLGQRLVGELSVLWSSLAPAEGRRWLVAAMATVDDRTPTNVRARLDYTEAGIANGFGQAEEQLTSSRRAVTRYRSVGDSAGIAFALSREVQALGDLARVAEAKSVLQEALPLARSVENCWLVGYMLRLFADQSIAERDLVAARSYLAQALRQYEPIGAKLDVAKIMGQLSVIELYGGNAELALTHATTALGTIRTLNQPRHTVIALNMVAMCLVPSGRYGEAQASSLEALDLASDHHLHGVAAEAILQLGKIAALRPLEVGESRPTAYLRAGRLLGFAHARLMGSARHQRDEQPEYDQALSVLHNALGTDAVASLLAEGATMTEEQAVELALAV